MKFRLLILLSCLSLTSAVYACGGDACNSDESSIGGCGGSDPYSSCSCVDPACGAPYSCMSGSACCSAFGNIGAFDSSPSQDEDTYSYSTTNLFDETYAQNNVAPMPYRPSYKGE